MKAAAKDEDDSFTYRDEAKKIVEEWLREGSPAQLYTRGERLDNAMRMIRNGAERSILIDWMVGAAQAAITAERN